MSISRVFCIVALALTSSSPRAAVACTDEPTTLSPQTAEELVDDALGRLRAANPSADECRVALMQQALFDFLGTSSANLERMPGCAGSPTALEVPPLASQGPETTTSAAPSAAPTTHPSGVPTNAPSVPPSTATPTPAPVAATAGAPCGRHKDCTEAEFCHVADGCQPCYTCTDPSTQSSNGRCPQRCDGHMEAPRAGEGDLGEDSASTTASPIAAPTGTPTFSPSLSSPPTAVLTDAPVPCLSYLGEAVVDGGFEEAAYGGDAWQTSTPGVGIVTINVGGNNVAILDASGGGTPPSLHQLVSVPATANRVVIRADVHNSHAEEGRAEMKAHFIGGAGEPWQYGWRYIQENDFTEVERPGLPPGWLRLEAVAPVTPGATSLSINLRTSWVFQQEGINLALFDNVSIQFGCVTETPSAAPTSAPTNAPTSWMWIYLTDTPTAVPTAQPTYSESPTAAPTASPVGCQNSYGLALADSGFDVAASGAPSAWQSNSDVNVATANVGGNNVAVIDATAETPSSIWQAVPVPPLANRVYIRAAVNNSVAHENITGHADMNAYFVGGSGTPSQYGWRYIQDFTLVERPGLPPGWVMLQVAAPVLPGADSLVVSLETVGIHGQVEGGNVAHFDNVSVEFACITETPSAAPTAVPTAAPTDWTWVYNTKEPTAVPTAQPTMTESPTAAPTAAPTRRPTVPTASPTEWTPYPSSAPTAQPTPSDPPTAVPTASPVADTGFSPCTWHRDCSPQAFCHVNNGCRPCDECVPEFSSRNKCPSKCDAALEEQQRAGTDEQTETSGPSSCAETLDGPCTKTWQCNPAGLSWADSYSVGGRCYCWSNWDHGIGEMTVDTPAGTKTVREVCDAIRAQFGEGPTEGRQYYNTVQCGHGPANDHGDEDADACPGRVEFGESGCRDVGPCWDLEGVYGSGSS